MPFFGKKKTGGGEDQAAGQPVVGKSTSKKKPTLQDREKDAQNLQQEDQQIAQSIQSQKASVDQHKSKRAEVDAELGKATKASLERCAERDVLTEALAKARALRGVAQTELAGEARSLDHEKAEVELLRRRLERLRVKQAAFQTAVEDSSCLRGEQIALNVSRDSNGLAEAAQALVRPGLMAGEAELASAISDRTVQRKEHERLQTEVLEMANADPGKHGRLLVSRSYLKEAEEASAKVAQQVRATKEEFDAARRAFELLQANDVSLRQKLDAARIELASMSSTYRQETEPLPSMIVEERAVKEQVVSVHAEKMVQIERLAESHIKSLNASATWLECKSDFPAPMWSARSAPPRSLAKELEMLEKATPRTKKSGLAGSDLTRTGQYVLGMSPVMA